MGTKEKLQIQPGIEPDADILTPEQVAAWLQVNKSSIYKHKDQFGARKIAGAIRIPKANVLKILENGGLDEQEKTGSSSMKSPN